MSLKLSKEQEEIIKVCVSGKDVVINAVAGGAKSTTVRLVSEQMPEKKILYFVFNASARKEAQAKFPKNVKCHTLHSLAWFPWGDTYQEKMKRPRGRYVNVAGTASEVAKKYKATPLPGVSANAIGRLALNGVDWFETTAHMELPKKLVTKGSIEQIKRITAKSDKKYNDDRKGSGEIEKVTEVNEHDINNEVYRIAKRLWRDRKNIASNVLISHNTYLKLFHLSEPDLDYDILIADEFQDVGGVAIDLLKRAQKKNKQIICVGDSAQAIYGWNHSLDGLNIIEGQKMTLSTSFRFGPKLATIASHILNDFIEVKGFDQIDTKIGMVDESKPFTWLFRTNMFLLQEAVKQMKKGKSVYIQGNISNFLSMVSSMQSLKMGDMKKVKHSEILIFETWEELVEEAEDSGGDLRLVVNLLASRDCASVLSTLRNYKLPKNWDIFMTTAHKAKGSEFDQVRLAEDFKKVIDKDGNYQALPDEERNLLYVASTRAKKMLEVNMVIYDIIAERNKRKDMSDALGKDVSGMTDDQIEQEFIDIMAHEVKRVKQDYM